MQTEYAPSKAKKYSDTVIKQLHPVVSQFGFTRPEWDYDSEIDTLRVQFEDPVRRNSVQIDCHLEENSFSAKFCRMGGECQTCIEGKPKNFAGLVATLPRWLLRQCPECSTSPSEEEESDDYSSARK